MERYANKDLEEALDAAFSGKEIKKARCNLNEYITNLEAHDIGRCVFVMDRIMNNLGGVVYPHSSWKSPVAVLLGKMEEAAIEILGGKLAQYVLEMSEYFFYRWLSSVLNCRNEVRAVASCDYARVHAVNLYYAGWDKSAAKWVLRYGGNSDKVLLDVAGRYRDAGNLVKAGEYAVRISENKTANIWREQEIILMESEAAKGETERAEEHFSKALEIQISKSA